MIPDADVVDRRLVLLQLRDVELCLGGVKSHIDVVQTVRRPCQRDIMAQKRRLQRKLVWLDDQPLKTDRDDLQGSQKNDQIGTNSKYGEARRVCRRNPNQHTNQGD